VYISVLLQWVKIKLCGARSKWVQDSGGLESGQLKKKIKQY